MFGVVFAFGVAAGSSVFASEEETAAARRDGDVRGTGGYDERSSRRGGKVASWIRRRIRAQDGGSILPRGKNSVARGLSRRNRSWPCCAETSQADVLFCNPFLLGERKAGMMPVFEDGMRVVEPQPLKLQARGELKKRRK